MEDRNRNEPAVIEHLEHAAHWHLLGLLLERPRPGWLERVRSLSQEVAHPQVLGAVADAHQATESTYLSLLGPGGVASPREVAYRGMSDPGRILADIQAFFKAWHFRPLVEDPVDHVAVQAGFIGYLHLKEAYALVAGSLEDAELCQRARARFLSEHLRYLAKPLARKLGAAGGPAYLAKALTLLDTLVATEVDPIPEEGGAATDQGIPGSFADGFDADGCAGCGDSAWRAGASSDPIVV